MFFTLDFAESLLVESEGREEKNVSASEFGRRCGAVAAEDTEAAAAGPLFEKLNFSFASLK